MRLWETKQQKQIKTAWCSFLERKSKVYCEKEYKIHMNLEAKVGKFNY